MVSSEESSEGGGVFGQRMELSRVNFPVRDDANCVEG
jgi:hypothetical protein